MREGEPQELGPDQETPEQEPDKLFDTAVVLSCGFKPDKPGDLDMESKMRILAGGILAQEGKVGRLILSGGPVQAGSPPAAEVMREYLLRKMPDLENFEIVTEGKSMDTEENTRNSAQMLQAEGEKSAILITNWFHLGRSFDAFERAGIETQTLSAEELVENRSSAHKTLMRRYLRSPKNPKNTAIDIVLRQISKTVSGRKMLSELANRTRR